VFFLPFTPHAPAHAQRRKWLQKGPDKQVVLSFHVFFSKLKGRFSRRESVNASIRQKRGHAATEASPTFGTKTGLDLEAGKLIFFPKPVL